MAAVQGLTNEPPPPDYDDGIKYFTPGSGDDMLGRKTVLMAYSDWKPDVIYMTGDAGSVLAFAAMLPEEAVIVPYIPVEGEPISNELWKAVFSSLNSFTCSKYGVDIVRRDVGKEIDYVYHGVDHEVFNVNGTRDETRKFLKWDNKFVITCVANNVGRKQIPRLIEAVSILKHRYKRNDIILYLHTVRFQNHWLEGHNLMEVARMFNVGDVVQFSSAMDKLHASIPERTDNPQMPGLVELYNASDLFVLPSKVEGFGLPIAEAMACGVPVLVTKYAAGWEVASPAGRGIKVIDYEIHKSGTKYANADIEDMAHEILKLIRNPAERAKMSAAGLKRVKDFNWEEFGRVAVEQIERAVDANKASGKLKEA